jgi:hypothetical protein
MLGGFLGERESDGRWRFRVGRMNQSTGFCRPRATGGRSGICQCRSQVWSVSFVSCTANGVAREADAACRARAYRAYVRASIAMGLQYRVVVFAFAVATVLWIRLLTRVWAVPTGRHGGTITH